ncbi:MAG: hypothetical protein ACRDSK_25185 [Actinophytocola sp.]|uniref:hypothetical protein n=1 Tax=Actinophytocola sp. TaxID=1872138 RepID=UPI003D6A6830
MTLLAELARLLRLVDPIPPRVLADAEAAGRLLRPVDPVPDAELLVLLLDTVPAVRSAGRRLTFGRAGGVRVLDVEIRRVGTRLRLAGLAPGGATVEIHGETRTETVASDDGYFTVDVPDEPVRLLVTEPGGPRRCTGWL